MDIKKLASEAEDYILARRRYYHAHPELPGQEKETRAQIHRDLEALGITDIRDMTNCYGLVADIHGAKPGKTVALRTDIDALPFQEETGLPYASGTPGVMHACGHDTHIAILLGAAKILFEHRDELCGTVRLVVQPSEETVEGARWMIEGGALEGVDAIYGSHIQGDREKGDIDFTYGSRLAYAGLFFIDVDGVSAHGSAPHLGVDAITAAAAIVNNLQQYVSRVNNPLEPLVVTVGTMKGGTRFNVIPNHVHMEGTLRAYTKERHEEVLTRIAENTAAALGCKATVTYQHVVDPLNNNDASLVRIAQQAVSKLYGADKLKSYDRALGSEDFANYAAVVPAVFGFFGARDEANGMVYSNHHEKFAPAEEVLQRAAAVMAQFAVDYLEENAE